jgi:hypothetical protein
VQCEAFLEKKVFQVLLDKIVSHLLSKQEKDGSWLQYSAETKRKKTNVTNIGYDDTGIIWFLLQYISLYPNIAVQNAIVKALDIYISNKQFIKHFYNAFASKESYELGDGGKGVMIMLIKAYETLKKEPYKKIVETGLSKYPSRVCHTNFSQENGLSAIGEMYLEAWRVFGNEEWKYRADWIANVFVHSFFRKECDSGYWVMEQNNPPTADLLIGNCGVLHFLARYLYLGKIGYRLLN